MRLNGAKFELNIFYFSKKKNGIKSLTLKVLQ